MMITLTHTSQPSSIYHHADPLMLHQSIEQMYCVVSYSPKISLKTKGENNLCYLRFFPAVPLLSRIKEEMTRSHSAFLVSSKTRTRSNRLRRGLARATFTDSGSLGLYWPLGLVAARIVVRVFSLHTMLVGIREQRWTQSRGFNILSLLRFL